MKVPLNNELTGIISSLRQKASLGWPELFFTLYTLISLLLRITLNPLLLEWNFGAIFTMGITFSISVIITCIAIMISNIKKIDWYGKEKDSFLFSIISYFYKRNNRKNLLLILFIIDPFLFFIYYKNGNSTKLIYKIKRWLLLILSLLLVSLEWILVGLLINLISWTIFLPILLVIIFVFGFIKLRK